MGGLIPWKKRVPVQVRRVEQPPAPDPRQSTASAAGPSRVYIPVAVPVQASSPPVEQRQVPPPSRDGPQPAGTQNVFYITVPGQQPNVPPPPNPPPTEVHYHTTVHHFPRSSSRRKSASWLGLASLALGVLACVGVYAPAINGMVMPLIKIGAALGGLGLLLSILIGHSTKGGPIAGLFVCGLVLVLQLKARDQLPPQMNQVINQASDSVKKLTDQVPHFDLGNNPPAPTRSPATAPHSH